MGVCDQARESPLARNRTMVRIQYAFLMARNGASRGRLQVIMRLEVKTMELSRQAIMRGSKQMPLKVVP